MCRHSAVWETEDKNGKKKYSGDLSGVLQRQLKNIPTANPFKGLLWGVLLSIPFWILIFWAVFG